MGTVATAPAPRLAQSRGHGRGEGPSPSSAHGRPAAPPQPPPCQLCGISAPAAGPNLPAGPARPGSTPPGPRAPSAIHRHKRDALTARLRPPWSPPWAGNPDPTRGRRPRRVSPGLACYPWEVAVARPMGLSLWRLRSTEPQRGCCRSGRTPALVAAPRSPRATWVLTRSRTTHPIPLPSLPELTMSRPSGIARSRPPSPCSGGGPPLLRTAHSPVVTTPSGAASVKPRPHSAASVRTLEGTCDPRDASTVDILQGPTKHVARSVTPPGKPADQGLPPCRPRLLSLVARVHILGAYPSQPTSVAWT